MHMLNAISWQQFTVAFLFCATVWYTYIGLRYYRSELVRFLRINAKEQTRLPVVANPMTVVMGLAKPDADTCLVEPEELIFSSMQPDDISDQTLAKGPVDDLLEEAKTLIHAFEETDNKPEFISLLKLLFNKYEVVADEISLPAVIASLKQFAHKLPFRLKDTEWPLNF